MFSQRSLVVVAASLLLTVPVTAQPEGPYTATNLGLLPGAFSNVPFAVNNSGQVVGWNQGPATRLRAFLWQPETGIAELLPPAGFTESRASDISHTGIIVGGANTGLGTLWSAWRLRNGTYDIIPPLTGGCLGMLASAVNDLGDVVGHTCPDGGLAGPRAWYFSDATGTVDLTGFGIETVWDISNAGVLTGKSLAGPAYRWTAPAGPIELLPTLPAPYNDVGSGEGINESGAVAARSIDALIGPDSWRATLISADGDVELLADGLARTSAYAINESGHVVGTNGTHSTTDQQAWIWTPERGAVFLEAHDGASFVYILRRAIDINDSGQIVGNGDINEDGGTSSGMLLTPRGACAADFNDSGGVEVPDIFAFLSAWFSQDATAEFDGSDGITVPDIFAFLSLWFAGCT